MTKPRLIYIYDALCGWCYGFGPVIRRLESEFSDRMLFDVMSGGMVVGDRIGPVRNFAGIIRSSRQRLQETTGAVFSDHFMETVLAEGSTIFSSMKPSIALCVLKDLAPDRAVEFASAMQSAIYVDGIAPDITSSYRGLAERFGLDADDFLRRMAYPHYEMVANKEFAQVSKWGIQGFPSVVLFHNGQGFLIARGYMPYHTLAAGVTSILNHDVIQD